MKHTLISLIVNHIRTRLVEFLSSYLSMDGKGLLEIQNLFDRADDKKRVYVFISQVGLSKSSDPTTRNNILNFQSENPTEAAEFIKTGGGASLMACEVKQESITVMHT